MAKSYNSSNRCSMIRDIFVTSASSCLSWCSSSLQTILPWFLNASMITRRSFCQITSIWSCIFRPFSLARFTCPWSGCRPSFPHITVNSSSSIAASSRPGISTGTAPSSHCWDFLSSDSLSSRLSFPWSKSSSLSSPELSDTSAAERAGTPASESSGSSSEDETVIISMGHWLSHLSYQR